MLFRRNIPAWFIIFTALLSFIVNASSAEPTKPEEAGSGYSYKKTHFSLPEDEDAQDSAKARIDFLPLKDGGFVVFERNDDTVADEERRGIRLLGYDKDGKESVIAAMNEEDVSAFWKKYFMSAEAQIKRMTEKDINKLYVEIEKLNIHPEIIGLEGNEPGVELICRVPGLTYVKKYIKGEITAQRLVFDGKKVSAKKGKDDDEEDEEDEEEYEKTIIKKYQGTYYQVVKYSNKEVEGIEIVSLNGKKESLILGRESNGKEALIRAKLDEAVIEEVADLSKAKDYTTCARILFIKFANRDPQKYLELARKYCNKTEIIIAEQVVKKLEEDGVIKKIEEAKQREQKRIEKRNKGMVYIKEGVKYPDDIAIGKDIYAILVDDGVLVASKKRKLLGKLESQWGGGTMNKVAVDDAGNIYVSGTDDKENGGIWVFDSELKYKYVLRHPDEEKMPDPGVMRFDAEGHLFVLDNELGEIYEFAPAKK